VRWAQGEHVAIIGSTGTGKTFLEQHLLKLRDYDLVLRTKADDNKFSGFARIRTIDAIRVTHSRYLLAPRYDDQRLECARALELAWRQGGWCIAIDELFYAIDTLKLEPGINRLLTQGRSKAVSVVCGMQRPTRVSRFALSEATHIFVFRAEGRDVKIIADATTPRVVPCIEALRRFEFAYFNRRTNQVACGRAQTLGALP
jgi:hypothetical protein